MKGNLYAYMSSYSWRVKLSMIDYTINSNFEDIICGASVNASYLLYHLFECVIFQAANLKISMPNLKTA